MNLKEAITDAETMAQRYPNRIWHVVEWENKVNNFCVINSSYFQPDRHPEAFSFYNTKDKKVNG